MNPLPSPGRVLWRRLSWFVGGAFAVAAGLLVSWTLPILVPLGVILIVVGAIASFGKGRR